MSATDWSRVEDLFHRAAELPGSDRSAFLDAECRDAPRLRADVESLLEHDTQPGAVIREAVGGMAETMADHGRTWLTGRRIGPYRVQSAISEGGMGAVYRAVRDDDHFRQQIALKVVRPGLETKALEERFRAERQILASLDHPHIARLMDGGATPEGAPYFVMELIEGAPITRYCAERSLSTAARLRLFQKVCEAVQYAHAKLIAHRDLKPGNILITPDGCPKLLDFGIAKILATDRDRPELEGSETLHMLTPEYASPEQVRGEPVTASTDIYSLGALLYELLTGYPPHRLAARTPAEIERAICTVEPALPSQCAEAIVPRRRLAGDLDNIVLMALRKEPERRYRSVEQFSEDITRHLEGRPVRARADTLAYRAGKFVRRNRLALAAVTAVMLSLAGGIVATGIHARREERRFEQVRRLAHAVLFDIHDRIRDLPGGTAARELIVKTALQYLSNLSAEARGDAALEAELAEAYLRVGDVQGNPLGGSLGDSKGALTSYLSSVALYRSAAAIRSDAPVRIGLAKALNRLGARQHANGDKDAAQRSYSDARGILDGVLRNQPPDRRALRESAVTSMQLSRLIVSETDIAGAFQESSRAVEITTRLLDAEPNDQGLRDQLAGALTELGSAATRIGDIERTLGAYRRAVELRERLVQDDSQNTSYRRSLLLARRSLGDALGNPGFLNIGDVAGAHAEFQKSLEIAEALATADPANQTAQMDLAEAHFRMGRSLDTAGRQEEALPHLWAAREITIRLAAADPHTQLLQINLNFAEARIGAVLASQGNLVEGIARMRKGIGMLRELLNRQPQSLELTQFLLLYILDYAPALGRAHDRASLDALTIDTAPLLERFRAGPLGGHAAARGPRTLAAFGEGYRQMGDKRRACYWFGESVAAWRQIEGSTGIAPRDRPLEAATVKEYAGCRGGAAE